MTQYFEKRPTFESLVTGRAGIDVHEKHRKWLELAKDFRLTGLEGATSEQRMLHDLRVHQAIRRSMDVRAAAMASGMTVGEVLLRELIDIFAGPEHRLLGDLLEFCGRRLPLPNLVDDRL